MNSSDHIVLGMGFSHVDELPPVGSAIIVVISVLLFVEKVG
jgi:hypothetical protein